MSEKTHMKEQLCDKSVAPLPCAREDLVGQGQLRDVPQPLKNWVVYEGLELSSQHAQLVNRAFAAGSVQYVKAWRQVLCM